MIRRALLALALAIACGTSAFAATVQAWPYTALIDPNTAIVSNPSCGNSAVVNISSATSTEVVPLTAGKTIHICGYSLTLNGTTPSAQFEYGGSGCSSPTVITGAFAPLAGSLLNSPNVQGYVFPTIALGSDFCIVSGGTTPSIQGYVLYSVF